MKNSDKKRDADSPLLTCDFSEIERRIMAWDGWHEGPIVQNGFPLGVSPTGRFTGLSGPDPQYLAPTPKRGVASDPIVNPNEDER